MDYLIKPSLSIKTLVKIIFVLILSLFSANIFSKGYYFGNDTSESFSKSFFNKGDIEKICDAYINNNLHIENPIFIDINKKEIFDMLVFNEGNVEYYKNIGSLDKPEFVLENSHYNKYKESPFLNEDDLPPIFFAKGNRGEMNIFVVKKLDYNSKLNKYNYRVLEADNIFSLDEESLITLILAVFVVLFFVAYIIFIAYH